MPLFRLAAACLLLLLGLADLATPTRARTLIETVNPDGSPVDRTPKTVEYNWSDHTPAGVMRGTWDIADDDPRLQPAPEGHPEQIALLYYGTDAVRVGWATGSSRMGPRVQAPPDDGAASIVKFGVQPGVYHRKAHGTHRRYEQRYVHEEASDYISPRLHSVVLDGLKPATTYYYRVSSADGEHWSEEQHFRTLPGEARQYPLKLGLMADVGQTYNSSVTYERMLADRPQVILHMGDLSYSDDYLTNGGLFPWLKNESTPLPTPPQSFQPRWDKWARLVSPLFARIPFLATPGNHEIEVQPDGRKFVSYTTRLTSNHWKSGSTSPLWYSMDVGPVHVVFLTSYADYGPGSKQMAWLKEDLERRLDRQRTPWFIAVFHAPWYTSYAAHYFEANCHRQATERLLYEHGVDVVLNGHVHAFERTFAVYDFVRDDCGPVHLSMGDGGNIEKLNAVFADSPGHCPGWPERGPSYQPDSCPQKLYHGDYCSPVQPAWSAIREPTFGHAILDVLNDTHARFQWKRNMDPAKVVMDEVHLVRNPEKCVGEAGRLWRQERLGEKGVASDVLGWHRKRPYESA